MWSKKEKDTSCGWQPYLHGASEHVGVCATMCLCGVKVSVCGFSGIKPELGALMCINCDLAISLPGEDKS